MSENPSDQTRPQWHLLGAGSLGCLFAAYWQRAGLAIELIVRDHATLEQLRRNNGITLQRDNTCAQIDLAAATPDAITQPITHLIICTKAQQTLPALLTLKNKIAADAIFVLLQNGMGVRERVQDEFPNAIILHALSTEGAFRQARFHITHAGRGETLIGAAQPQHDIIAKQVAQSLHCELKIHYAADIAQRLWLKLAVNSVINPLTAIHRCRNGELLQQKNIDAIIRQLCDEFVAVANAEGIALTSATVRDEIYRVIHATAQNKSSMLQDIEMQRSTEIDFISGFIVARAAIHPIHCPQHAALLSAISALKHE